jgi:BREX system ATP-binding protein BrxC/D
MLPISPQRRDELLDALRRGTVPSSSLDLLAVGLDGLQPTLETELESVRSGRGVLKAVRGDYGSGKTEAAVFPLLSRLLSENWEPISVLYVSQSRRCLIILRIVYASTRIG